jgi:hypothetical protein
VSGQLHAPARIDLEGTVRSNHYVGDRVGCSGENKNILLLPRMELLILGRLTNDLVVVLTHFF